jgi:uncharacterized membrane protein YcaP (DUF421 family)
MFEIDWEALLVPSGSLAEVVVRGSFIYLLIFAALRLLPRRAVGAVGASDLLVLVLIADAVQNAMAGEYHSITEGAVLAGTIFGWATLIDWLDYRFPGLRLAAAGPRQVIRQGEILWNNLKREQVSEDELMSELRQQGLDSTRDVIAAYIEGDGHFSVLKRGGQRMRRKERKDI